MELKIKRIDTRATLPSGLPSEGLALCSIETRTLRPGQRHLFHTGLEIEIPEGMKGVFTQLDDFAEEKILVSAASFDLEQEFKGPILVSLLNEGTRPFLVEEGMKIALLVVSPTARKPAPKEEEQDLGV